MRPTAFQHVLLATCATTVLLVQWLGGDEPPRTGPRAESRFPPLKIPAGFKVTLFACDPLIEYPSVISIGPRPGAIFVAVDYMTGLGTEIVRRDEVRLVEDTDGDGYADKATVFAKGFNSIQGLAFHDGALYVMHAPFLTLLRDTKGAGEANERRDLLVGLGLPPEKNPVRLHCANGVIAGHDGWLYLALGDYGADVVRPEGDRLLLQGGGILRCRPDGRDLHVFATGLRNIYDIALDAELNVFVRDNENDGGTYMIRVCHSFHGADHGYPYLYEERPAEALPPLADLGRGSSAGGLCYLEKQFPPEYRGDLFFCEWGRSVVRYQPRRAGSGFAPLPEIEFAAGAADDPYGFKPTDLVVQRDGTLMVSDWADGQRPKRSRGRIYHIAYAGDSKSGNSPNTKVSSHDARPARLHMLLDSDSYADRCDGQETIQRLDYASLKKLTEQRLGDHGRCHVIWALARVGGSTAIDDLLRLAKSDPEPSVRAQAIRAVADLADPVFTRHRLNAGPGDADLSLRLAALGRGQDRRVLLEIIVALGRLGWKDAPNWLRQNLVQPDAALTHAAMQTLRRSENWQAILSLLDEPADTPIRSIALRAIAAQFDTKLADGVIERLGTATDADRRSQYADALTRIYKKPGSSAYWGFRPPPRPANSVEWERTEAIGHALANVLEDSDWELRLAVLKRMQREKIPVPSATLAGWLKDEYQPDRAATILASLADQPVTESRAYVESIVRDRRHNAANRLTALGLFVRGLDAATPTALLDLSEALEDGPVLVRALNQLGKYPKLTSNAMLKRKLQSQEAEVRAAAIEALGELRTTPGSEALLQLLQDEDARVRRAAATAVGKLEARPAIDLLLKLAKDPNPLVRQASLDSLRSLRAPHAVSLAIAALHDRVTALTALEYLQEFGGPEQAGAVVESVNRSPSADMFVAAVRVLNAWRNREGSTTKIRQELDRDVAELHGADGNLVRWNVRGPVSAQSAPAMIEQFASIGTAAQSADWETRFATGTESRVSLAPKNSAADTRWLAWTDVVVSRPTAIEFLASAGGGLQVWLNGQSLYRRKQVQNFQVDSDRFAGKLAEGVNRLMVQVEPSAATVEFHLRFRRKSARAEHERLTQVVLARSGDPQRGRKIFLDVEKSLCLKCHRLGDQGELVGPDLTAIGSRFSRIYLVESILEPSRTVSPSFATQVLSLKNGKTLAGVKILETESTLTLADNQGQKHVFAKADIDEQQISPLSSMPEGIEKRFTENEFVDLISFLVSQKEGKLP